MDLLVAIVAQRKQVPSLRPLPGIIKFQCQLWMFFYIIYMMHRSRFGVSSAASTDLALIFIHLQYLLPHSLPFWTVIKPMQILILNTLLDKLDILFCHMSPSVATSQLSNYYILYFIH